ncbi:MAG: hypothetical protein DBX59_11000 [Bacillota bacterium]|nr:MAG: hypothetical protein DBX59_11000 [Bacillota bacterium]
MKRLSVKIIAIALCVCCVLSFAACKKDDPTADDTLKFTDYPFITESVSEYKIVYPQSADTSKSGYKGARELKKYIETATGAVIPMISDAGLTHSDDNKYLSVGKTALLEGAGVELDADKLQSSGLRIKTVGKSIYLAGATEYGTLYAAYEFLNRVFGMETYAADETYIDTGVKTIKLPDMDVTEVPSFNYRIGKYGAYNAEFRDLMRVHSEERFIAPLNGYLYHNSFKALPTATYQADHPDWYSTDGLQLCYNARGNETEYAAMVDTASDVLLSCLQAAPSAMSITFTHEDFDTWCGCAACSASKEKYGVDSATAIGFVNDLAVATNAKLKAAGDTRENIIYWLFAYGPTLKAPVTKTDGVYAPVDDGVDMRENNIGIIYAPILMDYTKPMTHVNNAGYKDVFAQWSAMTDNVYFWGYDTIFSDYFNVHNTFGTIQENLKVAKEYNVVSAMLQGQHDQRAATCFNNFKIYLAAKFEWNLEEKYDDLFNAFFDHYFKDASATMKELFISLTTHCAWFADEYNVYGQGGVVTVKEDYFPKGAINNWLELIDRAYADIAGMKTSDPEGYERAYNHINQESLAFRYMLIQLYGAEYLDSELTEMKTQFRRDCGNLGVTHFREHQTIDGLWSKWNLA